MSGSTLRRAPGPALVGLRAAGGEERVFGAALLVVAIHLLSIAVGAGNLLLALCGLVVAPLLYVLFEARGRVLRTLLAAAFGLAATAAGVAMYLAHALLQGPDAADFTGVAA